MLSLPPMFHALLAPPCLPHAGGGVSTLVVAVVQEVLPEHGPHRQVGDLLLRAGAWGGTQGGAGRGNGQGMGDRVKNGKSATHLPCPMPTPLELSCADLYPVLSSSPCPVSPCHCPRPCILSQAMHTPILFPSMHLF